MTLIRIGFDSNEEEVVPKVDDVSLVDGVFDGAFGGDGDEDFVIGEGVRKTLEWKPWMYGGGEEKCGKYDEEHGEGDYLTMINGIKEDFTLAMFGLMLGGLEKTRGTLFVNELTKQVGKGVLARDVPSSFPSLSSTLKIRSMVRTKEDEEEGRKRPLIVPKSHQSIRSC
ncbi:hypothetical protein Tco_0650656 [Tanacetum coccineum]